MKDGKRLYLWLIHFTYKTRFSEIHNISIYWQTSLPYMTEDVLRKIRDYIEERHSDGITNTFVIDNICKLF